MGPADEAPGPAPHRVLVEVGRHRGGDDRGHRHGQQLGEDVERCRQPDDQGRVVGRVDGDPGRGVAAGVGLRARDRKERPRPASLGAGIQGPQVALPNVARLDRAPVVEPRVAAQVEGVDRPCARHLPALGEAGLQPALGVELRQVIEQQGDDFAGRDIGGERRVERPRIVVEVVVQGSRITGFGAGQEGQEGQGTEAGQLGGTGGGGEGAPPR